MYILWQNLSNLLTFSYWFNLHPEPFLGVVLKILYVFFGMLLLTGIVLRVLARKNNQNVPVKKTYEKLYYLFSTLAVIGLILMFFRQQRVLFLGAPFWFLIWLLVFLVWLFFVLRYILIKVPKLQQEIALKKELKKYLP
ncbi:MAG TPA: hypothetical protein PLH37_01290 [bacterium]|nr:hypothetical protein [bacterium]